MTKREVPRAEISDRENQEIHKAVEFAEQAAVFLSAAEQGARTTGDTAALARLAYQLHKGGIDVSSLLKEITDRVAKNDRITLPQPNDEPDYRDWELMDIGAWQQLAGDAVSAEHTLQAISDPTIKIDMLCRIAGKTSDPTLLAQVEPIVDALPESSRSDRANLFIDYCASQGDRATVERLVQKYYTDPNERRKKLLSSALLLGEHGCATDDIVMAEYQADLPTGQTHIYREQLIEGLVKIGRMSEATTVLLESPEGDSPEVTEAWEHLQQAQAEGNTEVARLAWEFIVNSAELDPDLIKAAGLAAASLGDIPNTQAMLQLLKKETTREVGTRRRYSEANYQGDRDDINGALAIQYIERRHTASEQQELVARFKGPIALGVKNLILETIADPYTQVIYLKRLATALAEHGINPNFGGVVDAAEKIITTHPGEFDADDTVALALKTAKQLAELSFKDSHPEIIVRGVKTYLDKANGLLKKRDFTPQNLVYYQEEAWVVEAKLAAGLGQQARKLLGSGHKTKARITTQLRKAGASPAAWNFLQSLQVS
ncbi:MAG: hypothetical protein HY565_00675 [Candidatus Kerfeldbacteria bacterium]|nr:hypothetical protein [Candidatus Kerfeldbacteria bacterium]